MFNWIKDDYDFKNKIYDLLIDQITPISKKIKILLNDEKYLDDILLEGSLKADNIAIEKIKKIKDLIGF